MNQKRVDDVDVVVPQELHETPMHADVGFRGHLQIEDLDRRFLQLLRHVAGPPLKTCRDHAIPTGGQPLGELHVHTLSPAHVERGDEQEDRWTLHKEANAGYQSRPTAKA